jgi:Apea-like HEPN
MPTTKFPALNALQKEIEDKTISKSLHFLLTRRQILKPYPDLEDYAFSAPDPLTKELKGFEYHFNVVKNQILRVLRTHDLFIGPSVIEDLLFSAVRDLSESLPVRAVLKIIQDNGIHKPGLVIYPLHSFGVAGVGILETLGKQRFDLIIPYAGLAVRAQTNSLKRTIQFFAEAATQFRIARSIPTDSLKHNERIPILRWLTHNPLLVLRVRTFSAGYYENQAFIVIKLKMATSLIFMLSALESGLAHKGHGWTGTRSVNNFQTLDIKHYLVFEPRPRSAKAFESRRVPMNVSPTELAELTAVPVDITPGSWMRRKRFVRRICSTLANVEDGYLRAFLHPNDNSASCRTYRKLFSALAYFRRSFRLTSDVGEAYVNLAVAFEVLLTDSYAKGVDPRIQRRLRRALKGTQGCRALNSAAAKLYQARSEIVHTGRTDLHVDLQLVRQAFIHALAYIVDRVGTLSLTAKNPVEMILGK